MLKFFLKRFKKEPPQGTSTVSSTPKVILTQACLHGVQQCLLKDTQRQHEGITYLFGRTDGEITIAVSATTPAAHTTYGSFEVSSISMAKVVRSAAKLNLQIVAQVHTHPGAAYHSKGDEEGARIKYNGYVSIVLPNYGKHLPSLEGAAIYIYQNHQGFISLQLSDIAIAPEIVL